MNLTVTQDNLYLFLPGLTSNAACIIADRNKISVLNGIRLFYASDTYKSLEIEKTKTWHQGPVDLCASIET